MRSIVPFELSRSVGGIDDILTAFDWTVPEYRGVDWPHEVEGILHRGSPAPSEWIAPRQGSGPVMTTDIDASAARPSVASGEPARRAVIELAPLGLSDVARNGDHQPPEHRLRALAAREAARILDQVDPADKTLADLTFQYPILDRRTQTWGTVHYEDGKHHVVIRLQNSQGEKLKLATQRLVEHLIAGGRENSSGKARLAAAWTAVKEFSLAVWYVGRRQRTPAIAFEQVKLFEPDSTSEALTGTVVTECSLDSVLRSRKGDLKMSAAFLFLSVAVFFVSSPWMLDLDRRVHDLPTPWHDGWLAWWSSNLSRLGTALLVAAFLPLMHVWLYWRRVRREPVIYWNIDSR